MAPALGTRLSAPGARKGQAGLSGTFPSLTKELKGKMSLKLVQCPEHTQPPFVRKPPDKKGTFSRLGKSGDTSLSSTPPPDFPWNSKCNLSFVKTLKQR